MFNCFVLIKRLNLTYLYDLNCDVTVFQFRLFRGSRDVESYKFVGSYEVLKYCNSDSYKSESNLCFRLESSELRSEVTIINACNFQRPH